MIFRSMWRSYQGSVSLWNVYRKQARFRGCWHRAAVGLFAFAFDLWAGQRNKGRKPSTRPHRSADMQHHAALNPGIKPRQLAKNNHDLVFHDYFVASLNFRASFVFLLLRLKGFALILFIKLIFQIMSHIQ